MKTLRYTCVQISLYTMVCKFAKYKEKGPRQFFVLGCHGNAKIHRHTKFHFHALHGLQV